MISNTKLKNIRLAKGLTQETLSEISGLSIRTIQRIEKGVSDGSPYTLNALANALNVENSELLNIEGSKGQSYDRSLDEVKLVNLSSISLLIIPFGNILFPLFLVLLGKGKEMNVISLTRKIFSFQILYSLLTITLMVVVPLLLLGSFEFLKGSKIPLFIPVYYLAGFINILIILQTAIKLNKAEGILKYVPNLL